jgi:hypothetical protein
MLIRRSRDEIEVALEVEVGGDSWQDSVQWLCGQTSAWCVSDEYVYCGQSSEGSHSVLEAARRELHKGDKSALKQASVRSFCTGPPAQEPRVTEVE